MNETIPLVQTTIDVAEDAGVEDDPNQLTRKRKKDIEATTVSDFPPANKFDTGERSSRIPEPNSFKHWLSSMPDEDQKVEMFDNYVSPQDMRTFKKETLDIFIAYLVDDFIKVCVYRYLLSSFLFLFRVGYFVFLIFSC